MYHSNAKTDHIYQGKNQQRLAFSAYTGGYKSDEWITYLQAKEIGQVVKKGEQGTSLQRVIKVDPDPDDESDKGTRVTGFTVFNIEQTKELPAEEKENNNN